MWVTSVGAFANGGSLNLQPHNPVLLRSLNTVVEKFNNRDSEKLRHLLQVTLLTRGRTRIQSKCGQLTRLCPFEGHTLAKITAKKREKYASKHSI